MKKFLSLIIFYSALLILSCNTSEKKVSGETSNAPAFDLAKARADIEAVNLKWTEALSKGDSTTMASLYSSDAMAFPPNMDAVKANGLSSLWGSFIRMGVKGARLTTKDVTGDAEMLTETGEAEIIGENNAVLDRAKYVVTWKNVNGAWKIYRDIWNSNMPASTPSK